MRTRPEDGMMKTVGRVDVPIDVFKCMVVVWVGDPVRMVHDFLYSGGDPEATRADADDIFRDMQISLGIPRWQAYIEWGALRLFGKSHWTPKQLQTETAST